MDILSLTPEELKRLTPDELQGELQRLTPEEVKRLAPEQVAAAMEILNPAFRLTPDEQQRRDAARRLADAGTWRIFTASCLALISESYDAGEIALQDAIEAVGRIAIGCHPQDRVQQLGMIAALLLQRPTEKRDSSTRRPAYPQWIRKGTADLILMLKEQQPHKRLTPGMSNRNGAYDPSSPLIDEALEILKLLRWFGDQDLPRSNTIDDWVRARQREAGQTLRRGRPRTNPETSL